MHPKLRSQWLSGQDSSNCCPPIPPKRQLNVTPESHVTLGRRLDSGLFKASLLLLHGNLQYLLPRYSKVFMLNEEVIQHEEQYGSKHPPSVSNANYIH